MSKFLDLDGLEYYTDKVKAKFTEIETSTSLIEDTIGKINEVLKDVL